MSDAANLLSILRGELPVPPLAASPAAAAGAPPVPRPRAAQADAGPNKHDANHLNQLLSRLSSPSASVAPRQAVPAPAPPPAQSPANPLLSLLQGGGGTPKSTPPAPPPAASPVPNFHFVSPFDLLSSASNSPAPARSVRPAAAPASPASPLATPRPAPSIPTAYLAYSSVASDLSPPASPISHGLRMPSSSLPPSPTTPQTLKISLDPLSHRDSLVTSQPVLTPITLFTPQLATRPQLGAYRRLAISETAIAYAVQQSSKKPKSAGGGIRVIDRDSGARVLIEKPFATTATGPVEVSHLEFSKGPGEERGLLVVGSHEGTAAVWHGKTGFEQPDGKDAEYRPRTIIKPSTSGRKITLAKFHPSYPTVPTIVAVTDDNEVSLFHLDKMGHSDQGAIPLDAVSSKGKRSLSWKAGENVSDVAFSPDGSLLAILGTSTFDVVSAAEPEGAPGASLLVTQALPTSIASSTPSEIALLTSTDADSGAAVARGVAVTSARGTQVDVLPLVPSQEPLSIVSIELESPTDAAEAEFHSSKLAFDPQSSTLFASSSLRGSIFAFKVAYSSLPPNIVQGGQSDAETLRGLVDLRKSGRASDSRPSRSIRISHVLETPHPTPILQFVLDSKPSQPETTAGGGGALVLHSQGIQHLALTPLPASSSSKRPSVSAAPGPGPGPSLSNPFASSPLSTIPFPPAAPGPSRLPPATGEPDLSPTSTAPSTPSDELDKYLATGRRMSLEGSIHVQSEVEVEEEQVDAVSWEFMRRASIPIGDDDRDRRRGQDKVEPDVGRDDQKDREVELVLQARRDNEGQVENGGAADDDRLGQGAGLGSVDEPVKGDIANALALDAATTNPSSTTDSTPTFSHDFANHDPQELERPAPEQHDQEDKEIKLSGPVVNAAIKSMKAKKSGGGEAFSNTYKNYSNPSSVPGSPSAVDPSRSILPPTPSTPVAQTQSSGVSDSRGGASNADGWKRLETELPRSIEDRVSRQLERYLQRFEDERSGDQASNTAREETLLKLVSQSVTKGTGRALETALAEMVLPAIEDVVNAEIERGLEVAVRKILPREISAVILDPNFTRSLAGSLVPTVEKTVTQLVLSGLVPSFKHTLHKSVDEILGEMRGEMVGVRKEIVREQSATVDKLEEEVGGLKKEVGELKTMLARMEKVLLAQQSSQAAPVSARLPPAAPASSAASTSAALSPRSSFKPETLPPIPRTDTPPAKYEDMLTTFLQPSESPSFPSLVYFLNSSPPARLDRIFPPPSSTSQRSPAISMAVTLSLAFRLSELIKSRDGAFSSDEQKFLEWLKRAIGACNDQQPPEFLAMIPRILDMVRNNLVTRGRNLMAVSDHRGAGEIRIVEQYARARLSMFH
ncbi:hypothetical protein JCM11491_003629 [Sporobolomyces phaffii]